MEFRIFNRRAAEIRRQAGEIPPGRLTENNSAVILAAGKYVRYFLLASALAVVACWYLIGQAEADSEAYKTLRSSASIISFGVVTLGIIYGLFRGANWMESRAIFLDDRERTDDPNYPPSREVRRYMERAIFMIQLGYRLVTFAGICVVVGVIFVIKGFYAI